MMDRCPRSRASDVLVELHLRPLGASCGMARPALPDGDAVGDRRGHLASSEAARLAGLHQ